METNWQIQVSSLRAALELVKEQMENESQQKIQNLIYQHRSELGKSPTFQTVWVPSALLLDCQWENLIHQKNEAIRLVEDEYVMKYKTLEEQFHTQQKSHEAREVELLKTIDSLKNEVDSRGTTIDDLQSNVETLEGGVQVLNQQIAHQGDKLVKGKAEADSKLRFVYSLLLWVAMMTITRLVYWALKTSLESDFTTKNFSIEDNAVESREYFPQKKVVHN